MKSIPLLFSPSMSEAVRREVNPKTQTRRKSFKGAARDIIWGRESFYAFGYWSYHDAGSSFVDQTASINASYLYLDNQPSSILKKSSSPGNGWHKRPSLFMPKVASRIHLHIKNIRHEALQDISENDAIAEGIEPMGDRWKNYQGYQSFADPRDSFRSLWDSINFERGLGWDTNPNIVVVEFERI